MALFSKTEYQAGQVDKSRLPRHIAIIMDGNGRWAKKRGLPRTAGHKVGAETFRTIATYCKNVGVEYLTVYAFSTENWKRPAEEVGTIMGLLKRYMLEAIDTMEQDNIKLKFFGDLSAISPELQELVEKTNAISERLDGFQANICLNYGGRAEILHAAKLCAENGEELTEERRKDLVKQIHKYAEGGKVAIRNIRRDAMDNFKKQQKNSEITEDELKIVEKDLQKLTDDSCKELDKILEVKEKELMSV